MRYYERQRAREAARSPQAAAVASFLNRGSHARAVVAKTMSDLGQIPACDGITWPKDASGGAQPDWWDAATVEEREAKGYKRKLVDFENQEVELQYRGHTVCCEACQALSDADADEFEKAMGGPDYGPDPHADDVGYQRYCSEMSVVGCLANEDWAEPE